MTTPAAPAPATSAPAAPATPAPQGAAPGATAPAAAKRPLPGAPSVAGSATPAAAPTEPAAPKPPEKRKFKLKVDQQEVEEELSDDEVTVRLQKGRAAERRMQEAAQIRKEFAELKALAKSDPALLLKELAGLEDPDAWAEQRLAAKWKRDVMPEAERKAEDQAKELEGYKAKIAAFEAEKTQAAEAKQMAALEAQTEAAFKRAFEVSGLPWTPEHLDAFGKIALEALDYNMDLTPEQMAAEVKAQLGKQDNESTERAKTKLLSLKGDDLLTALGDEAVKEVIRASVAKRQAAQQQQAVVTGQVITPKAKAPEVVEKPKFRTTADWRKQFGT